MSQLDKKALYETIMRNVSKIVKQKINESVYGRELELDFVPNGSDKFLKFMQFFERLRATSYIVSLNTDNDGKPQTIYTMNGDFMRCSVWPYAIKRNEPEQTKQWTYDYGLHPKNFDGFFSALFGDARYELGWSDDEDVIKDKHILNIDNVDNPGRLYKCGFWRGEDGGYAIDIPTLYLNIDKIYRQFFEI